MMMTAISRAKITMNAEAVEFNILRLNLKINNNWAVRFNDTQGLWSSIIYGTAEQKQMQ